MRISNRLRRLEARKSSDEPSLATIDQFWMVQVLQPLFARCRYRAGTCDAAAVAKAEAELREFERRYAGENAILRRRPRRPNPEFDALVANVRRRKQELQATQTNLAQPPTGARREADVCA
jgi:hypothetical protein